ncbi:MAG: DUF302 domain-containing protein [Thermoplasmata archaeon]
MSEEKLPYGLFSIDIDLPFEEAMERVQKSLTQGGFTIFAVINHKEAAKGAGMEMNPASVIIFGNPAGGTILMKESDTIAIDLPARILVSGNGKTKLYFNKMEYVKERHSLNGKDEAVSNFDKKVVGILENIQ